MTEPTTNPNPTAELLEARGVLERFPRLSTDDRAELRTVAYPILAGARTAASSAQKLSMMTSGGGGFYQAAIITAVSALSAIASGLCLLGATIALALSSDAEEAPPATPIAPTIDPVPPAAADDAPHPDTETNRSTDAQ